MLKFKFFSRLGKVNVLKITLIPNSMNRSFIPTNNGSSKKLKINKTIKK